MLACSGASAPGEKPSQATVYAAPAPAGACAWFGDERAGVLYFGISAFWDALRASGGDPHAETRVGLARELGRFDLARSRMLAPLAIGPADAKSGVWDVLAHPNGWLYFTTFFESAGRIEPESGRVEWFTAAGSGLNELALGPSGRVLASRYGSNGESGSVVVLGATGELLAVLPLAEPDRTVAAKSLAYDRVRDAVWVNTDLLGKKGEAPAHDARVLALADGRELARWAAPELQFMAFGPDGTGYLAERSEELLRLRVLAPDPSASPQISGRRIPLDDAMPATDFAQEVRALPDGRVLVTRWSGRIHVVSPQGRVADLELSREGEPLYYTGVAAGARVCATACRGIQVVCRPAPR